MTDAGRDEVRKPRKILEVIVTSLEEAVEAERGGADRLELVRAFEQGGLTPSFELVQHVTRYVKIPVRVIFRSTNDFRAGAPDVFDRLCKDARALSMLPINGLVAGFAEDGELDLAALRQLLASVPNLKVTFHRAFDSLVDKLGALDQLRTLPQIDRVLTRGCDQGFEERKRALIRLQEAASPNLRILVGGEVNAGFLSRMREEDSLSEFHVGRAARVPAETFGAVRRTPVAELKNLLV